MVSRFFQIAIVCAASSALLGAIAAQDDSKDSAETTDQAKRKIAVLLAKARIVQSLSEKSQAAAKQSTKGRNLVERRYEGVISELRQKHKLESWNPDETEELIGTRSAAAEFLDALAEARDNIRRKAQAAKKTGGGSANAPQATPGGPPIALTEASISDINRWRGDVIRQGDLFSQNLQNNNDEKELRQAWRAIQDRVIEVFDRIHPVLLADKQVSGFHQDGLIQSWTRRDSKEDLAIRASGCTKVQVVTYDIVDAYGVQRNGKIAIGLFGTASWDLLKENTQRGGFYELVKAD